MFFSITEQVLTLASFHLWDQSVTAGKQPESHCVAIMLGISAVHLLLSWRDQALSYVQRIIMALADSYSHFIAVLSGEAPWMGLILRDVMLSLGDFIAIVVSLLWFSKLANRFQIASEAGLIAILLVVFYMFYARDY